MIIKWPLNGLFHDRCGVIIMSQMVIIRIPSNDGHYLKCWNFDYDDQKSRNVKIMERNDLEMTVSENHDRKL